MDEFYEVLSCIFRGFKVMGVILVFLILIANLMLGVFFAITVLAGKLSFSWWYVPCWLIDLLFIAFAIGTTSKD